MEEKTVTSWTPTTIIRGTDILTKVSTLRGQPGGDIYVYGGGRVLALGQGDPRPSVEGQAGGHVRDD